MQTHAIRRLDRDEARARAERLRAIFRDAVLVAGPTRYSVEQCAAWATTADDGDRWALWFDEGATWIATCGETGSDPVGLLTTWPDDHVHLLYVDPAFHRRGIATALLEAVERDARARGIGALTTEASLIAHPVFAAAGFALVEWEAVERRGQVFRRAKMRKALA